MDPDQALKNAREAIKVYEAAKTAEDAEEAADKIVSAFESLDGWLSKGGFPPHDWDRNLEKV